MIYAGIGTRKKNSAMALRIHRAAMHLKDRGWHLRSGGAEFSDTIHESVYVGRGASVDDMSIFLPWDGFNGRRHMPQRGYFSMDKYNQEYMQRALKIAEQFHPNWGACNQTVRVLMARNALQILGASLNQPIDAVVAYTDTGRDTGGTGQAIRHARSLGIPVFNLFHEEDFNHVMSL